MQWPLLDTKLSVAMVRILTTLESSKDQFAGQADQVRRRQRCQTAFRACKQGPSGQEKKDTAGMVVHVRCLLPLSPCKAFMQMLRTGQAW